MSLSLAFSGDVLPTVSQQTVCEPSFLIANFSHPRGYTVLSEVISTFHLPKEGDKIRVAVRMHNEEKTVRWELVTKTARFTDSGVIDLVLDQEKSHLNGTTTFGSVILRVTKGHISYSLDGSFNFGIPSLPLSDGAIFLNEVVLDLYVNEQLVVSKKFEFSVMNTRVVAAGGRIDFAFGARSFNAGIFFDFKRPHNAKELTGRLEFQDSDGLLVAHLDFNAVVEENGRLSGSLRPASHINQSGATAYVTGAWTCNHLELAFQMGSITGDCEFLIPMLEAGIIGIFNVEAV